MSITVQEIWEKYYQKEFGNMTYVSDLKGRFVVIRDVHSSKELAKGFQPARAYTYEAAINLAKECASLYPGVSFLVCEIRGKAGIQEVVYSEL
jgi:hypothetical protein